jgi:hypothetical protein
VNNDATELGQNFAAEHLEEESERVTSVVDLPVTRTVVLHTSCQP